MSQYVYFFGDGGAEGKGGMKDLLGGKGAGLAEMTNAGLPVPPGFTISTDVCKIYYESDGAPDAAVEAQVESALARLEKLTDQKLGDADKPLLVSVRSGAKFSMPGMMDTILNLGLNPTTVEGMARRTENPRFAWDSYRRFIQMFGNVVLGVPKDTFEDILEHAKDQAGVREDPELSADALAGIADAYKKAVARTTGNEFSDDPHQQLRLAINAVFGSWNNPRAIHYRRMNRIPTDLGTAVNVQAMVFGNMGDTSGTGVGFTRNPSTGEHEFYGEFLMNAQGEDVVAGIRTPVPIAELESVMPDVYQQLRDITTRLEKHYRDVQDFEFTIQDGRLYMLQTRNGKRTGPAAVRIAVEMVREGLIDETQAIMRVDPAQLDQLLHPQLDADQDCNVIATGLPASPGAATGKIVFTADDAAAQGATEKVILVRKETVPDDIHGMEVAAGILTARGGMTSHAAVVARGMGKCCVAGVETLQIDERNKTLQVAGLRFREGDFITLDGSNGRVIEGRIQTKEPDPNTGDFAEFMAMADSIRRLGVRTNADGPRDAEVARKFGAEGIGLCRTEHMFFAEDRLAIVQEMILASSSAQRRDAVARLLPVQRQDFEELFRVMDGLPVTIRLLDPPLHEFLPKREDLMVEVALLKQREAPEDEIEERESLLVRVEDLFEFNPMLGHRGCRLGITHPEISEMQVRAIIEAACTVGKEGVTVEPEIMIPLVGHPREFEEQKEIVDRVSEEVFAERGMRVDFVTGTMIELPRAAIVADKIAESAQFFSFGTNDLTQTAFGYSRDDAGKFIDTYVRRGILEADPFRQLDRAGVGELVRMACEKGREVRSDIKLGICGEHGGDPASVRFFHDVGLHYVSCSPYRVPIARLAAAQAAISDQSDLFRTV